jgi:hypothetical protein
MSGNTGIEMEGVLWEGTGLKFKIKRDVLKFISIIFCASKDESFSVKYSGTFGKIEYLPN